MQFLNVGFGLNIEIASRLMYNPYSLTVAKKQEC